jgi:hypothetical protein
MREERRVYLALLEHSKIEQVLQDLGHLNI